MGVDSTFMSAVARGDSMPSIVMVVGLLQEFGIDPRWYLTGEGAMRAPAAAAVPGVLHVREPEAPYSVDGAPCSDMHQLLDAALREATPAQLTRLREQLETLAGAPDATADRRSG